MIDYQSHLDLDAIRRCALASGVNRQRDFRTMSMGETLKPFHQLSTIVIVTLWRRYVCTDADVGTERQNSWSIGRSTVCVRMRALSIQVSVVIKCRWRGGDNLGACVWFTSQETGCELLCGWHDPSVVRARFQHNKHVVIGFPDTMACQWMLFYMIAVDPFQWVNHMTSYVAVASKETYISIMLASTAKPVFALTPRRKRNVHRCRRFHRISVVGVRTRFLSVDASVSVEPTLFATYFSVATNNCG